MWEIVLRVGLAVIAGGIIGIERELQVQPAGLRTHVLVALGACTFTLGGVVGHAVDPTRLAASVATGIGFLGAGVILHDRLHVKGLTTAASLWVAAALGVAAGLGAYVVGAAVTAASVVVLVLARPIGGWLTRGRHRQDLAVDLAAGVAIGPARTLIEQLVGPFEVEAVTPSLVPTAGTAAAGMRLVGEVRLPAGSDVVALAAVLRDLDGVTGVHLTR